MKMEINNNSKIMKNGNEPKLCILETIPEETGLPRISELIPKSPETRRREQEYEQFCEQFSKNKTFELFFDMLIMNNNINRICSSDKSFIKNLFDLPKVTSSMKRNYSQKIKKIM